MSPLFCWKEVNCPVNRLTTRLAAIGAWVPPNARLADVGTDHGYLPVQLLLEGKILSAIATDLRPGPLAKAAETVERWGVAGKIDLRLCDGLAAVSSQEVDAITIAGMGGETILAILSAAPWALDKCCLVQAMSSQEDLRAGLEALDAHIVRERVVKEGQTLYVIAQLGRGGEHLTPAECWAGKAERFFDDPLWPAYLAQRRRRAQRALDGLTQSSRPENLPGKRRLERILKDLPQE